MRSNTQYSKAKNTRGFANKSTVAAFVFMSTIVLVAMAGAACAPPSGITDKGANIKARAAGPPIGLSLSEVQTDSITLEWGPPTFLGTKIGKTEEIRLQENELAYQVYYMKGEIDNEDLPSPGEIKTSATSSSSSKIVGTVGGVTSVKINDLEPGNRYFLVVESYNSFAVASTLSGEIKDVFVPIRFTGDLAYETTKYEPEVYDDVLTITPETVPTVAENLLSPIRFSFRKIEDGPFPLPLTVVHVDERTGVVTINPTVTGTMKFAVVAEATDYFSQEVLFDVKILPRVAGAVTGLEIESTSIEDSSLEVKWTAPEETGTRQDGTILAFEELAYRVYYVSRNTDDAQPEAEIVVQEARTESNFEQVQGITNVRIINLSAGTQYFVAVETYNPFTDVGTLSETVVSETTTMSRMDLSDILAYGQSEYSYPVDSPSVTIMPSSKPTVTGGPSIRYGLYKRGGVPFPLSTVVIDSITGEITVDPSATTIAGEASYQVFARVEGFNSQYVEITIRITQIALEVIPYYSQDAGPVVPVPIGQAIWDDGTFSLANDDVVLSIESAEFSSRSGSESSSEYIVHLDTGSGIDGSRDVRLVKTPNASNRIVIQKLELGLNNLSTANGAVIGLSGPGIAGIQEVAIYRPEEIRNWQDLQAMRVDMEGSYVMKNDIQFPETAAGTGNYESIGNYEGWFKGNLDGGGFRIIGMQVESDEYFVGIFGYAESHIKDLVLLDCTFVGRGRVGSIAGQILEGTIINVGVELSAPGKARVEGGLEVGGLVGVNAHSIIEGYSNVPVIGTKNVGGLVGNNNGHGASTSGYATGDVTGEEDVGGLVGINISHNRTSIVGYATGDVTGISSVGGLIGGANYGDGKTRGYATGKVTGDSVVGGLVGHVQYGANITGYATGDVVGIEYVGGMFGYVTPSITSSDILIGYSRSTIYRSEGDSIAFGKVIGRAYTTQETQESIRRRIYSSQGKLPESGIYNIDGTMINENEVYLGEHGNPVDIDGINSIDLFSELFSPEEVSDWEWSTDKWPALDLGDVISASDQPID